VRSRVVSWAAVGLVFVAALGVRLVRFADPPLDFHPTRQFRSALLARRFFLEREAGVPASRLELARGFARHAAGEGYVVYDLTRGPAKP
jgi:hypothetical protein